MKCILYTSVLSGGGAERVLCQLANNLSVENEVILVAAYKTKNEYKITDSVKKEYIDESADNRHSFRQIRHLRNMIKKEKPDICISFLPQPNFKLIMAKLGLKTKVMISVRNDPTREYAGRISRIFAKFLYPIADGVVFQTIDAQKWFPDKIQSKSKVIMNQVDEKFFVTERKAEDYYVATGRLNNQKNYPMMIRAFAAFVKKYPQEQLCIYGVGDLLASLQNLITEVGAEGNIHLMGSTTNIPDVLSHAKAFLMTSDYEGMPNGLLEAMAVGLPCICTDCPCGGPHSIINNRINGVLIRVGDEDELCRILIEYKENTEFRNSCAEQAKSSAVMFKPEVVFSQWEQYIKNVLCQ